MNTQHIDKLAGVPCETHAQSEGHPLTVGDGFQAQSYKHADFRGLMDPLIMVDHFVMTQPTFGTHAHAGLSAVTVMFEDSEGAFRNRDSLGNDLDLAPGDLYWFKAARGALHNEATRPGAKTHALQVFVNLPAEQRHDAPAAFHLAAGDIPKLTGEHATARLLLGDGNGISGAAAPDISLTLLDINMQAGGQLTHQGDSGHHAWILAIKGTSTVTWNAGSAELQPGKAIAFAGASPFAKLSSNAAHLRWATRQRLTQSRRPIIPVASDPLTEINIAEDPSRKEKTMSNL